MSSTADPPLVRQSFMRATDALAASITACAIPLLILTTTRSTALTGIAFLLEWLPRLTSFAVGGPLVDRFRADRVFRTVTTVRALLIATAALALAWLPAAGGAATAVTMATGAVGGLLAQASFVAIETLGAHASRRAGDQAHRVQSIQIGVDQGAQVIGPLLASLLLMAGHTVMLLAVAALSAAAAVSTTTHTIAMSHEPFAPLANLRAGWHTVTSIPALAWLITGLTASNLTLAITQASSPIMILTSYDGSALAVGTVWSTAGTVSLGGIAASRRAIDRFGLWPVGASAALIACVACLGAALAPNMVAYSVAITMLMAGEGAMVVVLRTLRVRLIPETAFGSTLSVTIVLIILPMPLAGALVAALPAAALSGLLLACTVTQGAVMACAFRGLWRHRDAYELPQPPTHTSALPEVFTGRRLHAGCTPTPAVHCAEEPSHAPAHAAHHRFPTPTDAVVHDGTRRRRPPAPTDQ